MASERIEMCLVLVLVLMLWSGAKAQTTTSCTNNLMGLSPCLSYVTGNSSTPSATCCSQLAGVVQSAPRCLCSLTNGAGNSMGLNINQTLALALPGACNVQTPPISQCNAVANGPASSPAASPAAAPATSPPSPSEDGSNTTPENPTTVPANPTTNTTPTIPSGTASKTVPTTTRSPSDGNLVKPALFLFLAAFATTLFNF